MISRSQRILGLDIGSSTVKGVELAKNGENFTITGYAQAEIAAAGTLRDAIVAVIKEGRFKSKQVVSSVSGRSVIVRYVNTPVMNGEELKSSMRFEADKYIPFEMDEVILDTVALDETPDEKGDMRVVLVAVKKDIINEHVRLLQDVGLYPYIIDVDCFALGNSFEFAGDAEGPALTGGDNGNGEELAEALEAEQVEEVIEQAPPAEEVVAQEEESEPAEDAVQPEPEEGEPETEGAAEGEENNGPELAPAIPDLEEGAAEGEQQAKAEPAAEVPAPPVYALVDIGAQKTNINIMNGNISCFTREVYIGGEDMTEAVAKHLGISPVEAEAVKRQGEQEGAVLEAVSQSLDDLANEIFLSFDYFENQFENEIGAVYISGGGSKLPGIAPVLSETLGRTVSCWDPTSGMEVSLAERHASKLRENAPQLAVVMGLASRLRKV
ncbi:MAG: pilus assembly protein PilM [Planctomycetota bacterium]|jgi:Tfp pilus assembly PilM family ATPase